MFSSALPVLIFLVIALFLGSAVWKHRPFYARLVFGCVALILGGLGFWIAVTLVQDMFLLMFFFQIGFGWVMGLLAMIVGVVALVKWINAPSSKAGRSPRSHAEAAEPRCDQHPQAGK